jgi:rfaE bifunctional protein kinase chain/domain
MPARERYRTIVGAFARTRVAVIGDLIADEFIYGQVARVSREAPVLILEYDSTVLVPGGAGNAANNAAALGAKVTIVGAVGRDAEGRRLVDALSEHADTTHVVRTRGVTTVKTRILAGGVHSAKQQVVRIDKASHVASPALRRQVRHALVGALQAADVVIVSDYGSGLVTPDLIKSAVAARRKMSRTEPLVFVDSRHGLSGYSGVTACTPNESEVEALLGVRIGDDLDALERAGRRLLGMLDSRAVLITRGSRGMALFEPDRRTEHIPIVGSDEIADVTGAGDTVIATFALAVASGATFSDAAHLANYAGGLVVMKRGTATVTARELLTAFGAPSAPRARAARHGA